MIDWREVPVYLHRDPVDFRKAINGLSVIVQDAMGHSPFEPGLFVFCNRRRNQLKVLYWDATGFALWQKRLEQDKFKWPMRHTDAVLTLNQEQWNWLLRGLNFMHIKPHNSLFYEALS